MRYLWVVAVLCCMHGAVWAGPHRGLCEKTALADLIVEIEFKSRGSYPDRSKERGHPPPARTLEKTIRTGVVTAVYKGDVRVGDAIDPQWPTQLSPGRQNVRSWTRMLQRKRFRHILFFQKKGDSYGSASWAEGSADCGSDDTDHRSWCAGYNGYKDRLAACMDELIESRLSQSVKKQLQAFCAPGQPDVGHREYRFWIPKAGTIPWVETRRKRSAIHGNPALIAPSMGSSTDFLEAEEVWPTEKTEGNWPPTRANRSALAISAPGQWQPCAPQNRQPKPSAEAASSGMTSPEEKTPQP